MPRTFDGANDSIHTASGALSAFTFGTLVAVVRRNSTAYNNILTLHNSGGTSRSGIEIEDNGTGNHLQWQYDGNFVSSMFTVVNADGWVLIAMGKGTGTSVVRCHKYVYATNTWTHSDSNGTATNSTAPGASSTMRFGEWEGADDLNGDIAIAGAWLRNLSDAEVEQLAHSLTGWYATAPDALWLLDQQATSQAVVDLAGGGANQSAITGTAVATTSFPGLSYGHEVLVPHSVSAAGDTPIAVDDTGSSSEATAITATAALADAASAAEAATATVTGAAAGDTGSAADGAAIAAAVPIADAASAADTLASPAAVPLADTGSTAEATAVTAAAPLADAASSAETATAAVTAPLADTAAGSDSLLVDVGGGTPKALPDSASAADTLTAVAAVGLADAASAAEAITAAAASALADAASAVDAAALAVGAGLGDAGTAGDALAVTVLAGLTDTGTSAEAVTAAVTLGLVDTAAAVDVGTGQDASFTPKALADTAAASDRLRILIRRPNTGTAARPATGTIARPNTGTIFRP